MHFKTKLASLRLWLSPPTTVKTPTTTQRYDDEDEDVSCCSPPLSPITSQYCRRGSKCSYTTSRSDNTTRSSRSEKIASLAVMLFRRRSNDTTTTCESVSEADIQKEFAKVHNLYALAADELNFAEDSRGSPYYAGDLITAREAIDSCATAFMHMLEQVPDPMYRSQLHQSLSPQLIRLEERYAHLPPDPLSL